MCFFKFKVPGGGSAVSNISRRKHNLPITSTSLQIFLSYDYVGQQKKHMILVICLNHWFGVDRAAQVPQKQRCLLSRISTGPVQKHTNTNHSLPLPWREAPRRIVLEEVCNSVWGTSVTSDSFLNVRMGVSQFGPQGKGDTGDE